MLATPAAARRRTGGEPSTIIGVEIVVVAAVGTGAAKVSRRAEQPPGASAADVTGGAGAVQVTAETKLTRIGDANMLACAEQDPQDRGCAG